MEELIHNGSMDSGKETIMFPKLKFLSLRCLPKLLGLCHNVNTIELPQLVELKLKGIPGFTCIYPQNKFATSSLLKEEVVIPKLEIFQIDDMENLKKVWPCEFSRSGKDKLRKIQVCNCDKLVNLFPYNPMSLLHHLEELKVENCGSIESLFNIDLDCAGGIGEEDNNSNLRSIKVDNSEKLREVWRIKGADNSRPLIRGFQAVEIIKIERCKRFRNIFTPIATNFDMGALLDISIYDCGENRGNDELEESRQEQEQTEVNSNIFNVALLSCLIHSFHNIHHLGLSNYGGVEVVFEIESPTSRELVTTHHNQQQPIILPNLEELYLSFMGNMSHVWKCNSNKFFTLQKQQSESPFHNLTTIHMLHCKSIKYLFSPLMAKLLSNLNKVEIEYCYVYPDNLKSIGGGGAKDGNNEISFNNTTTTNAFCDQFKLSEAGGVSWSLCQYSREIEIQSCHALSIVIPCYAAEQMQKLQLLKIKDCDGMKEVFETQCNNKSGAGDEGIPRVNNNAIMLPNLKRLEIRNCGYLEHILTFSALESLRQLEELTIWDCKAMKVIVKEEDAYVEQQTTTQVVVFPHLKSIVLVKLPELVGFFLGKNEFQWRSLEKVIINKCPKMRVFAPGGSTAPKLKYIHTELGKYSVGEYGLNFHQVIFKERVFDHMKRILKKNMVAMKMFKNEGKIYVSNNKQKLLIDLSLLFKMLILILQIRWYHHVGLSLLMG